MISLVQSPDPYDVKLIARLDVVKLCGLVCLMHATPIFFKAFMANAAATQFERLQAAIRAEAVIHTQHCLAAKMYSAPLCSKSVPSLLSVPDLV